MPGDVLLSGLTRRRFLLISAGAALAACESSDPAPSGSLAAPRPSAGPSSADPPTASAPPAPSERAPSPQPAPTVDPGPGPRVLYRDAALADGRSDRLRIGLSVLVENRVVRWIRPSDDEGRIGSRTGLEIVDASGATIVPGMVDAHSHVTMPGGAHWIDRGFDEAAVLLRTADRNGRLLTSAGVRWARDVGAPVRNDPDRGGRRALSITVRERWKGRPHLPYIRAAGTWILRTGSLPGGLGAEASNADELLAAANAQLDDGADLVKLYLDGPDPASSPWSVAEVRRVVQAVHGRGAKVTAHSGRLSGARVGVQAGVDALEHGFELDATTARAMARRGTALVSTLAVMRSWLTFGHTTRLERFATAGGRQAIQDRLERAQASVRFAHAAGVAIASGTDFGGGSLRANQLAWEVESLVAAGLEPWEALGAATWRGGQLLDEPDAGVLREGGPADFFLVHGDPLSDPRALWRVWRVAWAD
ncbi:MAG TPA: amidohydrolase family protein [Candidatus Limnocylindrales bacterium]